MRTLLDRLHARLGESEKSGNVLIDDASNLRFIDPLILLKKPTLDVIKELIGLTI